MSKKQLLDNQHKKVKYDHIIYLINEEECAAGVIGCETKLLQIIIPKSIIYETKEYNVTNILTNAFSFSNVQSIQFSFDSKLQTIEKGAFSFSKIESFTFPSELVDLKEGWCIGILNVNKILISPKNPRYCLYENKLILGKSKIEQNYYDYLIFCVRNIKHIKIPNFIEHICSYSFNHCEQLETIELPSSVKLIGDQAFSYCKNLQLIKIPNDSKLQSIGTETFSLSKIESFTFPSELVDLKEGWCIGILNVNNILISPKNPRYCLYENKLILGKSKIEQNYYDCLIFCVRNIKHIKIPNFIEHICSYSFNRCEQLEEVEFSKDSKLQNIDKYAFCSSDIKNIAIPSSVRLIGERAFSFCEQLEVIEIQNDSRLQVIDQHAFSNSKIKKISIPSSVTLIGDCAFYSCEELERIEIPNDSNLQSIGKSAFYLSKIGSITIPSSVTLIGQYAFDFCRLRIIEINNEEIMSMCQARLQLCQNALLMIPINT